MFLKEAVSVFSFVTGLFTISGFAIKVDKFENNHIFKNSENDKLQMSLPISSFSKLKLKAGENFNYLEQDSKKIQRISQIEMHENHATLIFEEKATSASYLPLKPIKYYLESRPFWINLFK